MIERHTHYCNAVSEFLNVDFCREDVNPYPDDKILCRTHLEILCQGIGGHSGTIEVGFSNCHVLALPVENTEIQAFLDDFVERAVHMKLSAGEDVAYHPGSTEFSWSRYPLIYRFFLRVYPDDRVPIEDSAWPDWRFTICLFYGLHSELCVRESARRANRWQRNYRMSPASMKNISHMGHFCGY